MKELLTFSTKAKIAVGLIAVIAIFGFKSCDNSTSPTNGPEVPDDNHIGFAGQGANRIEFRVENVAHREAAETAFTAFLGDDNGATSLANLVEWANVNLVALNRVVVTGLVDGSVSGEFVNGTISGTLNEANPTFMTLIMNVWTMAHNATEGEILLADLEGRKAAADFRIASRASEGIVL